ncbi:hypothetical protein [Paracoccus fistulariae]|uniref:Uncharacterized protein n=2 Tax=Paracoccus fistulariae TaxID=658446 RepID=A0ABY7SQ75_9RHOB|nr:hypothetical protein [Paracoccus fistulariae]WCR09151.1 hypothetical protein JHX87_18185 [Paracoccus fistulariae]
MQTAADQHPMAPGHLPVFVTPPGETDGLMTFTIIFMIGAIFATGVLYLRLHSLPEQLAHDNKKTQFEIVAVLGLIALFTHNNIFWIAALLLALIDFPDFLTPLRSIARSLRRLAVGQPRDPMAPEQRAKEEAH